MFCWAIFLPAQVSVARWQTGKEKVYVGEPLVLSLKLFWSGEKDKVYLPEKDLDRKIVQHLQGAGFIISVENQVRKYRIVEKDKVSSMTVWKGVVFHPDPGKYTLGQELTSYIRSGSDSAELTKEIDLRFVPSLIEILKPPKRDIPSPDAVGSFTMEHQLKKKEYLTGEPIQLSITVKGKGGIPNIRAPRLIVPEQILRYDPRSEINVNLLGEELVGSKTFIYELTAAYAGRYTLGPVSLETFNPRKGKYEKLAIDGIPLKVTGKDIPRLVEVNALDNFYRRAFIEASDETPIQFTYASIIIWSSTVVISVLLLFSLIRELLSQRKKK